MKKVFKLSPMKSSINFLLIVFALSGCVPTSTTEEVEHLPNIIFVLVDDLGKEWISCYGAEDISTPHIDQLARSGMRFDNFYVMPQCTPTRLSLLTAQYPFRHGWVNHWDVPRWGGGAHFDERKNPSLPLKMRELGYHTAITGKWQIDDFRVEPDALYKAGFNEYAMWTGYETGIEASAERYQDPYIFTNEGSRTYQGAFGPDVFKNFAIDFIRRHKDTSFFLYYPMVLTHPPLVNTPDETGETMLEKHQAMVRYMDKLTGEIVAALEQEQIREQTIVIWTTDNGTSRGIEGNYRGRKVSGGKAQTTENGICAPLIVSWPGHTPAGVVSDALVDITDMFPTFIDLAGGSLSSSTVVGYESYTLDGISFKRVLTGDTTETERAYMLSMGGGNHAQLTENGVENQYYFRDRVLRNKRYKLYVNSAGEVEKLVDVQADPTEERNLLDEELSPEAQLAYKQLAKVIPTFPHRDNDPRYVPNPGQDWDVEITAHSQEWKK